MSHKDFEVHRSSIIPDVLIIQPSIFWDNRGNIFTSFNEDLYAEFLSRKLEFKHDKFALSQQNVLRGLHGDNKTWKLVSCVYGEIYEVVVDMRPESNTYLRWDAFELKADEYKQVLIPPNFVNGYYVKSENAVFHYKLAYDGEYIDAEEQMTFLWNDKKFGIEWPCKDPILQNRDKQVPQL
jgi:dTDP-4-dehydrorhamnose 3,5-epimerase